MTRSTSEVAICCSSASPSSPTSASTLFSRSRWVALPACSRAAGLSHSADMVLPCLTGPPDAQRLERPEHLALSHAIVCDLDHTRTRPYDLPPSQARP